MPDPKCKTDHAAVTSRYCPECGEELNDPEAERVAGIFETRVAKVLESYGFKKKTAPGPEGEADGTETEPKKKPASKVSSMFRKGKGK